MNEPASTPPPPADDAVACLPDPGHYLVAFVDLLGESNKLASIGREPKTEDDKRANLQALWDTTIVVRNVRNSFAQWFHGRPPDPATLESQPPEQREEFAKIRSLRAFHTGFSDSFVNGIPLTPTDDENAPVALARAANDIWMALFGLACMSLASLQQGLPLRAGIDIGLGMETFPREVYGPALLSAYYLESRVAEYPRAVFGHTFFEYLAYLESQPQDLILNRFTATMARRCREFVCSAPDDGWPMLHFLSPIVMQAPGNFVETRMQAETWAKERARQHWDARNEKLYRRYVRLIRYFEAFRPPLKPQKDHRATC